MRRRGSIARTRRRRVLEPWYHACKILLLPPFKLWFNWRFDGLEHVPREGAAIVVGNHLSYLDPFAHAYFVVRAGRRPRFLAKAELFENPFVRTVLEGSGQIPVRRGTGDQAPLEAAIEALARGEVVVVYPEGTSATTDPDFAPGRGKTGAVRLALESGAPVVPVATWGGQYVWRRSGKRRVEFARPIWLRAGEPLDLVGRAAGAADASTVRRLTNETMTELTKLVDAMRDEYPRGWTPG
jgi:1-acyl-sn-glycerol-3-phosphate acyltransferase